MKLVSMYHNFPIYAGYKDCPEEMEQISLAFTTDDYHPVLAGQIGNTGCCGSISIYASNISPERLVEYIRLSHCSVIIFKGYYYENTLQDCIRYINKQYGEVFSVEYHEIDRHSHLLLVTANDYDEYFKWMHK